MIKDYELIYAKKDNAQHGQCFVCGSFLSVGQPQLAHKLAKTKANIAKYGLVIIDSEYNVELVCSLKCNASVLIGAGRQARIDRHIESIREKL